MNVILEKRVLGNTGLKVSRLCFGTLALGPYQSKLEPSIGAKLLIFAYKNGINFWDTAELYETYPHILVAIEELGYPDDLIVASRSLSRSYDKMKISIENTLTALNVSKIPVFGLHELSDYQDFKESQGAFKALREYKEKGFIQSIAITMHSVEALKIATQQDWVDVVFPLYNKHGIGIKCGNAIDMALAIEEAYKVGKGIYAMKVLAGGHLTANVEDSVNFVLENPHVDSIAIGMDNLNEINMNLALFTQQKELITLYKSKIALSNKKIQVDPWCEGCGECIKICPNNAIKLEFSQAKVDPENCVLCGYCASVCKYFCIKVVNSL